ncbi:MAG: hypothetical protein IKY52_12670 [Clostridia bacterium]|nr:hypothetical protein [Clostridia bacterium]
MTTYFNNEAMHTEDLNMIKTFYAADYEPHRFIRIALDKDGMLLDYMGEKEYKIQQVVLFVWKENEEFGRIDFKPQEKDKYFYAAMAENSGVCIKMVSPDYELDAYHEFLSEDVCTEHGMAGLFVTTGGIILLTYLGPQKHVGFSYIPRTKKNAMAADQLLLMLELLCPPEEEE